MGLLVFGCKEKPRPTPPLKVQVVTVTPQDVPIYQQWIGTLDGYPNAQIRAQVSGYLIKQDYLEGSEVKKGDLLFELDPRPFQAALDQALGKLAQDEAKHGQDGVGRETLHAAGQASRPSARKNWTTPSRPTSWPRRPSSPTRPPWKPPRLNLGFCKITSPIDGIAGTAQAQIGDLVGPGGAVLTTVSTIDPMRVYFSISEQSYLAFCHQFTNAAERAAYREDMELQLILSDGSTYPVPGKWFFTSRQVDVNTGTLQIAGLFPNPDYILRPGQYALVRAKTETRHGAILLPQRAVLELQGSYQVATVDSQNKVHLKSVQVGEQVGNDWLIEKGLEPDERVVAEGTQKVKEGTVVDPQPYNKKAPKTSDVAPMTKE